MALVAVALASAWCAAIARADAPDPAGDYLTTRQVFISASSTAESPSQRQLIAVVQAANRAGFRIRVALINSSYDLGSVAQLWLHPQTYARVLGRELSGSYSQRLLVVMPNGFGFSWPGRSAAATYPLLAKVPVTSGVALAGAAATAVRRLAAATGVKLELAAPSPGAGLLAVIGVVLAGLLALSALYLARSLRRRDATGVARARTHSRAIRTRRRWAIPGLAGLCAVAVATPLVVVNRGPSADISSSAANSIATPPPLTWAAGRRRAPGFALRDQTGRTVTLAAYRGRPVVVTFVDPLCRNFCPLEAHLLNQVARQTPPAQRPEILAVSVNVYGNARANLVQDARTWELVPQWRWGVGSPAQLSAVWRRYKIGVSVTTTHVAGTTIRSVTHTEAAYVIDRTGHERALFVWPFFPQDIERSLRGLG